MFTNYEGIKVVEQTFFKLQFCLPSCYSCHDNNKNKGKDTNYKGIKKVKQMFFLQILVESAKVLMMCEQRQRQKQLDKTRQDNDKDKDNDDGKDTNYGGIKEVKRMFFQTLVESAKLLLL